jgi:D-threonate/D-erythronate kinase
MARMLVIADDLTGAADCAVACASHGLRSMVVLGNCRDADADVLAIDANTRAMQPEQAAAEIARLMRAHGCGPETLVYKKIDSTLRGNVAVELAAVLEARRALASSGARTVAVLAPAFPATGRTTINGRQLVSGLPLEETALWQYETMPARSHIGEMLGAAQLRSALVALDTIRCGGEALRGAMQKLSRDADVLVCDAETDEDLRAIAEASMTLGPDTIWAGSAGLAYPLPPAAGLARQPNAQPKTRSGEPLAMGPTLFVVGTGSSVSREQVRVLESWSDTVVLRTAPRILLAEAPLPEWRAHRALLERALSAGRDVAIIPEAEPLPEGQGPMLAAALAELVQPLAEAAGALVATGGETARAIFDAWGIAALRIVGEVEPGLPYSIAAGWRRPLPVLTKAGGFGRPETLLHCRQFLRALDRAGAAQPAFSKGLN